ncbi:MAG: NAD(P)H-hydrate dehydratase [Armatimonadetes bacterium]|nr:NAD(P)H-hydrate dehydratase [Armatimonadota bacterium]
MKLVTASQMRELDRVAIAGGMPGAVLMENAGHAVARQADALYRRVDRGHVWIGCGVGNNGGDGFVAARRLALAGVPVVVGILGDSDRIAGDALTNLHILRQMGARFGSLTEDASVVVDALLGTGSSGEPRGVVAEAKATVNRHPAPVVAVDVPTGVNADTGAVPGIAIKADVTVTFGYAKPGLLMYPGAEHAGRVVVDSIGFAWDTIALESWLEWFDECAARSIVPRRRRDAHKGDFGRVLIVGGSAAMSGAVALAARGALRSGAGLVTVAVPASVHRIVASHQPEVMCIALPERDGAIALDALPVIERTVERCDAVCVGPGLSVADESQAVARLLIGNCPRPLVADADALTAIVGKPEVTCCRRDAGATFGQDARVTVLTPHPGEAARLLGTDAATVQADRLAAVRELASRYSSVAVLKGAGTLIGDPQPSDPSDPSNPRVAVVTEGNPGMATAGSGDVLTGLVGGFIAQGLPAGRAAALAAYVHGQAGDEAARRIGEHGLIAGDIAERIPEVIAHLVAEQAGDGPALRKAGSTPAHEGRTEHER